MEIKRDVYLNRMIARMNNGFIKVITGIRRSGKSYLMNKLFYQHLISSGVMQDHIISFSFDAATDLLLINEDLDELVRANRKVDPKKFIRYLDSKIKDENVYYLLLDEIQNLANFETVLNGYLRKSNLDIYVTGSNSKFLSSDIITEFEGRGDEIHILPLSFSEFYPTFKGSKDEAFDAYSLYGGLPAIALLASNEQKVQYLITQMQNIYIRDIIRRYNLSTNYEIGELLDVIASGISSLTNPTRIANTFKSQKKVILSEPTIDKYINCFIDSFVLSKAKRYDVKGRKYINSPYKLYFEDLGLRNARINFRQIEQNHVMENIIYNELRYRGYQVDVGVVEGFESNKNKQSVKKTYEIDFVANSGGKRYYIQSAYMIPDEQKYEQEVKPYKQLKDSFKRIILVDKTMAPRYDDNGYVTMGIKEFLLDSNSLDA